MLEAHTLDAWTRVADRSSTAFRDLTILGGFGAPLFLWLAGLSLVLSAHRHLDSSAATIADAAASRQRREAALRIIRRGLQILVLAFLFRLQAFVVSPGGPLVSLFRVDILNVMGIGIAAAGVLYGLARTNRGALAAAAAAAAAVALATPLIRSAGWVDALPTAWQWYLRPAGEHTTFTLFPWVGFLFAGVAAGALLTAAQSRQEEARAHRAMLAGAAALVVLGVSTARLPSIYAESSFWTSSPTFFAIRVGVLLGVVSGLYWIDRWSRERPWRSKALVGGIETLGRNSLFIYWIHVEIVYGYASWPLWRQLPVWAAPLSLVVVAGLMLGAVALKDRVRSRWLMGGPPAGAPGAVTGNSLHAA
jgi:uncharacterized membrane protein